LIRARVISVAMIENEGNFKEIFSSKDNASLKIIYNGRNTSYL
jgi:hypothetical protein